ncbi:DUF2333 family protein [Congregibacter litoralis]|uniref:DUF2333 domain-containing protein n=1 Tax=Congregibacter litoralis KT71 TaxID=314285 RepID=A4A6S7_9GAMM|nr:DUF2333 family protein [Congregibacter litoralis]EAQ97996.1 hypothetical protein KT71_02077 [Congregibacter litoralis KT71]
MTDDTPTGSDVPKLSLARRLRNFADDYLPQGRWLSIGLAGSAIYLAIVVILGLYWSMTPAQFDVVERARGYHSSLSADTAPDGVVVAASAEPLVTGVITTSALLGVVDTMLSKPGGYLHNDRFPPGVYLDNIPNWEYGVLIQSRDLVRAMREFFSRSQSQSKEDQDLSKAEPLLNFQSTSWLLPATETEYRKAMRATESYLRRLMDPDAQNAQFYARADNLREWLAMVNTRLGSLSQRLSASVSDRRLNTDLAGDGNASQSTAVPNEVEVRTPWSEIDDVFFESRGAAWALIHFLKAIEVDFEDILQNKNAQVSLRQIIRELEGTQGVIWSPMILNGSGFGPLANHSLIMASYISRANAAIIDLRDLLAQG